MHTCDTLIAMMAPVLPLSLCVGCCILALDSELGHVTCFGQ